MLRFSRQVDYGQPAPDFALPDTRGQVRSLSDFAGSPALLVAFICNHCPVVLHMLPSLCAFAREYAPRGLQVVAISSNFPSDYPEDDYPHMQAFAQEHDLPFPYLHDDSQRKLYYAGQYCASRPKLPHPPVPGTPPLRTDLPVTGKDMRAAVDALLAGRDAPQPQEPSSGCSIKWRPEKDPWWS